MSNSSIRHHRWKEGRTGRSGTQRSYLAQAQIFDKDQAGQRHTEAQLHELELHGTVANDELGGGALVGVVGRRGAYLEKDGGDEEE